MGVVVAGAVAARAAGWKPVDPNEYVASAPSGRTTGVTELYVFYSSCGNSTAKNTSDRPRSKYRVCPRSSASVLGLSMFAVSGSPASSVDHFSVG